MSNPNELLTLAKRKNSGQLGPKVEIITNLLRMKINSLTKIYHYNLSIEPKANKDQCSLIMKLLKVKNVIPDLVVYDGRSTIYLNLPLNFNKKEIVLEIEYNDKKIDYKININIASTFTLESLTDFIQNNEELNNSLHYQALTALNIIMHQQPKSKMVQYGNTFFSDNKIRFMGGLELRQGYFQSVKPSVDQLYVNVDSKMGTFYKEQPLIESCAAALDMNIDQFVDCIFTEFQLNKIRDHVQGIHVYVTHMGKGKQIKYRIENISKKTPSQYIFKSGDDTTNVQEYFKEKHNYCIKYKNLPSLIVNKQSCLPMEVCIICNNQRYIRKLNEKQTTMMIKETAKSPSDRLRNIEKGIKLLEHNNKFTKSFDIQVENDLVKVNSRVLPVPKIHYHPTTKIKMYNGSWNLDKIKLMTGGSVLDWGLVYFENPKDKRAKDTIDLFAKDIVANCKLLGIRIAPCHGKQTLNPRGDVEFHLCAFLRKIRAKFVICVLPHSGSVSLYSEIKRICDIVLGIPSQCVVMNNIIVKSNSDQRRRAQYMANVGLKINQKLDGSNSKLDVTDARFLEEHTLIVGADVTHSVNSKDSETCSIAAIVGSLDKFATKYSSIIVPQAQNLEIIDNLDNSIHILLERYHKNNKEYPKKILFYRDGVSEGQHNEVYKKEILKVLKAFNLISPSYKPKLTFIIATKRHHVKFFPINVHDSKPSTYKTRSGNCVPGTIVDTNITHPVDYDFYLQSHNAIKGTARPTHYTILYDENNFQSDEIQKLTYNLCFTYSRSTCPVSLVTPVYYAHLVAFRARYHLKVSNLANQNSVKQTLDNFAALHKNLEEKMFFI